MAIHARQPDFVQSHMNLVQRVSNLETGVHPTISSVDYYDSYPPQNIGFGSSSKVSDGNPVPSWSRRAGMVCLAGVIVGSHLGSIGSGGVVYGTIPEEGRPKADTVQLVGMTVSPYWTRVKIVASNGHLIVLPASSGSGSFSIILDNVAYPFL